MIFSSRIEEFEFLVVIGIWSVFFSYFSFIMKANYLFFYFF